MKKIVIYLTVALFASSCVITTEKRATEAMEYAYFSGQVDAFQGDIRVDTTTFMWTKSPWNNGDLPIFMYGESELGRMAKQEMMIGDEPKRNTESNKGRD